MIQGTPGGSVLVNHVIWGVCNRSMLCICHCTLRYHITRHRTIVWLLELWIKCCFIRTHFSANHWKILIQRCNSCLCQYWRRCGPHFFPFLEGYGFNLGSILLVLWCELHEWDCQWGIIACLYLFLLKLGMPWCCVPRLYPFIVGLIPVANGSRCPIPDMSCVWQAGLLPQSCGVREGYIVSGVHRTAEVWIWCG